MMRPKSLDDVSNREIGRRAKASPVDFLGRATSCEPFHESGVRPDASISTMCSVRGVAIQCASVL
eukprot:5683469-Amphidinium_carterae.1